MKLQPKHIPNILSCIRLALIPVFVIIFFFGEGEHKYHIALLVFLLAGATDVVDGYLARKNNWISDIGKILDPLADKLMQCTVLICLAVANLVEAWFITPYILKEFLLVLGGYIILKKRKVVVVSNIVGKLAVVVFYAVIGTVMIVSPTEGQQTVPVWINAMCMVSLVCTVVAFVVYMQKQLKPHNQSEEENSKESEEK